MFSKTNGRSVTVLREQQLQYEVQGPTIGMTTPEDAKLFDAKAFVKSVRLMKEQGRTISTSPTSQSRPRSTSPTSASSDLRPMRTKQASLDLAFKLIDTDGDGKISRDEWLAAHRRRCECVTISY